MNRTSQRRKAGGPQSGKYGFNRRKYVILWLMGLTSYHQNSPRPSQHLSRPYMNDLIASANSSGESAVRGSKE